MTEIDRVFNRKVHSVFAYKNGNFGYFSWKETKSTLGEVDKNISHKSPANITSKTKSQQPT